MSETLLSPSNDCGHPRAPYVLLVEDYPANILVATAILDNLGVTYHTVDNGEAAVLAVQEQQFDMVLMDVQLPIMDGFTATRMIREYEQQQNLKPTPIIGVTAFALSGDRDRCLTAGMDDYISKPFTEEHLQRKISTHASAPLLRAAS